jgi:hypothetical protein
MAANDENEGDGNGPASTSLQITSDSNSLASKSRRSILAFWRQSLSSVGGEPQITMATRSYLANGPSFDADGPEILVEGLCPLGTTFFFHFDPPFPTSRMQQVLASSHPCTATIL